VSKCDPRCIFDVIQPGSRFLQPGSNPRNPPPQANRALHIGKGDIEASEKVQKRATKMLPALKSLPYKDRLKACNISTLHHRRIHGDMIETYKILTGKYDTLVSPTFTRASSCITRGNDLRLQKNRFKYDLHKYCFCNRVVNTWNSLPIVLSAGTTGVFNNRLDKFWHDQEIIYDFNAVRRNRKSKCSIVVN